MALAGERGEWCRREGGEYKDNGGGEEEIEDKK